DKFAKYVALVFVGNEILFSRGVCSAGPTPGVACTDNRDCGTGGSCSIGHYCSDTLSGTNAPAQCSSSATCGTASCTDVTNLDPLKEAFNEVQQVMTARLPSGTVPPISISLQVDLLVSGSFGDDGSKLMYSRQQLANALTSKVIAINTYPDQWGKVTIGPPTNCLRPSFPSCVGPSNAVKGQALLSGCVDDPRYRDSRTNKINHTIDNYFDLLRNRYYPGFDVVIAETGWHTAGVCGAYNDCTSTYSPQDAATYWTDVYAYVQNNKIPLLAFEAFDERTKVCDLPPGGAGEMAEANYGLFGNYCQLKAANSALLPPTGPGSPGPNLAALQALLDPDPPGQNSCRNQTLVNVRGLGNVGICEFDTGISCNGGYHLADPTHTSPQPDRCPPGPGNTDNRCVWGYCASKPTVGCNPDDPGNDPGCGACLRAGACAGSSPPNAGIFFATVPCPGGQDCDATCWPTNSCSNRASVFGGLCTDATCACYAAMTPSVAPATIGASAVEAPGFVLTYGHGAFSFTKTRTLRPEVFVGAYGIEVHPVWGDAFVGQNWMLKLSAAPGAKETFPPGPCPENTIVGITGTPGSPTIQWKNSWTPCNYPVGGIVANQNSLNFPRGYLSTIPTWPPKTSCSGGSTAAGQRAPSACGGSTRTVASAVNGKAQNVADPQANGSVRITGRFTAPSAIQLDKATVTIKDLLDELGGAGELSERPGGGALLPLLLSASKGSKPNAATYQTDQGTSPSVSVDIRYIGLNQPQLSSVQSKQPMQFTIVVDHDSMPNGPQECAGNPLVANLQTSFTIDDGSGNPVAVGALLPWKCHPHDLQVP
ncbi:MAG TPA: hypothetical protein VMS64_16590, partial [Candidatus Methylomirabilis sp.]|nr:hypothetical protein [Candidatus Methylomirabilis sp.]